MSERQRSEPFDSVRQQQPAVVINPSLFVNRSPNGINLNVTVVDAGGMRKEVAKRDGSPRGAGRHRPRLRIVFHQYSWIVEFGKIGGDGIAETHRSCLTELENRGGDDGLREGGHGKDIVGRHSEIALNIPSTERSFVEHTVADADVQHRSRNVASSDRFFNRCGSLLEASRRGRRWLRRRRSQRGQAKWPQAV